MKQFAPQTSGEWVVAAACVILIIAMFGIHWIVGSLVLAIVLAGMWGDIK